MANATAKELREKGRMMACLGWTEDEVLRASRGDRDTPLMDGYYRELGARRRFRVMNSPRDWVRTAELQQARSVQADADGVDWARAAELQQARGAQA